MVADAVVSVVVVVGVVVVVVDVVVVAVVAVVGVVVVVGVVLAASGAPVSLPGVSRFSVPFYVGLGGRSHLGLHGVVELVEGRKCA